MPIDSPFGFAELQSQFLVPRRAVSGIAPTLTASDGLSGHTLTITVDTNDGVPTPSTALTALTLDGVDVLGDEAGTGPWEYVVPDSAASQTVAWTVTAANNEGSDTANGSEAVAANLFAPTAAGGIADQTFTEDAAITALDVAADFSGTAPITYALAPSSAALPAGLSLSSVGEIIGTPTTPAAQVNIVVRGTNAHGYDDTAFGVTVSAAVAGTIEIGYLPDRDEGTTGDYFVNPATGSDAGTGAVGDPFETVANAISVASSGDVIKLRAGTYREGDLSIPEGVTVSRYGTEEVIFTGGEPLTGWTQCTSADEALVGPNFANIYKITLPIANIAAQDPRAAWLHEAGEHLQPAMLRVPNARYPDFAEDYVPDFLLADEPFTVDGSDNVVGIKLSAATDGYTQAQIERCDIAFAIVANFHHRTEVQSFDTGTGIITPLDQDQERAASTDPNWQRATLLNLLPAMKRGEWGFTVNGSDTTLYLWPRDTANLASGIEYSARSNAVRIGAVNNVAIRGVEFHQYAMIGGWTLGDQLISGIEATVKKAGIVLENFKIKNIYSVSTDLDACIYILRTENMIIRNYEVDTVLNHGGIYNFGGVGANSLPYTLDKYTERSLIGYGTMRRVTNTSIGFRNSVFSIAAFHRDLAECGIAPHSAQANNKFIGYRNGCFSCSFTGIGYVTTSDSSAPFWINTICGASSKDSDGRGINDQSLADQTFYHDEMELSGTGYLINSMVMPYMPSSAANTNGIKLGRSENPTATYEVYNSIFHGHTDTGVVTFNSNIWTSGIADGTNGIKSDPATEYVNAAAGDFSFAAGAEARSITPADVQSIITSLAADITQFDDWDSDFNGSSVDWAAPDFGPVGLDGEFEGWLVDRGALAGSATVGAKVSVQSGSVFAYARPLPITSYQWQVSDDNGATWSDISGATNAAYDVQSVDVDNLLGVLISPGDLSEPYRLQFSSPVEDTFALGDPERILAASAAVPSSGGAQVQMAIEGGEFESDGTPLLVVVSFVNSGGGVDNDLTVTIGDLERTFGTGDAIVSSADAVIKRSSAQAQVFSIMTPPGTPQAPATKTIQAEAIGNVVGHRIDLFKVPGLTAIGAVSTNVAGTGATSLTAAVTTTAAASGVIHAWIASGGDKEVTSWSGGPNELMSEATGTNPFSDCSAAVAYQRAPDIGSYTGTTSHTSVVAALRAIELQS